MKINNNMISYTVKNSEIKNSNRDILPFKSVNELPKNITVPEQSQINSNLPVSYSKIGEMNIPGCSEKASVFKLANGQKVVICPKKGPVFVKTTYNVGSLNEPDEIRGISHFIEHNLFNGSKDIPPREYDKKVSDMGGYTNASTGYNCTDYYLSFQLLNENSLEEGIKLNAELTQYPVFPVEQLQKEKEPVKSEIDMYEDRPESVSNNIVLKNLFNIKSKSNDFIAGTKDNINSLDRDKVLDYFNTWYTPDNAVTVITGDVDVNETMNLVSKYYNKKNDYSKINQRQYEQLDYLSQPVRQDVIMKNSMEPLITMGFAIPEGTDRKDSDTIDMLLRILTSSSSRLSKELDKYGLSLGAGRETLQNKPQSAGAILLEIGLQDENQIENVLKILYSELEYIANNPPSPETLEKQKNLKIDSYKEYDSGDINMFLTQAMLDGGNLNYFDEQYKNISSLTPQDISNAAKKFLNLNKVSLCVSHAMNTNPEDIKNNYIKTQSPNAETISFGAKHSPQNTFEEETARIQQYKLPNNIQTMIIPGNESAQSTLLINFKLDNLTDVTSPAFSVLNELLNRGSALKSYDELNDINEKNNFSQSITADFEGISFSSAFSGEKTGEAMDLLNEIILNPNFSQSEFNRAKELLKAKIKSELPDANEKAASEIYGGLKMLKSTKEERLKELDELTLDDIKNLYSRIISNSKVSAVLSGDCKENTKNIFHNKLTDNYPMFKPYTTNHDNGYEIFKPNTQTKIYTEAVENKQAEINSGYTFKASENIEDKVKIELLNGILGGGMNSRLFTDLRENQKLAYHTGSAYSTTNDIGCITLNIGTTTDSPNPNEGSPENLKKALNGFEKNVNLLKSENVTPEELARAKAAYKTELLNCLETNGCRGGLFSVITDSKYGMDYFKTVLDAIDKVTPDDIRAAANYVFAYPPVIAVNASQKTLDSLNLN
ncbi:MAG: insulinase family protein [Candidatus Gastranaerophilales bacterium]|nr:insulinase family protein [Candidatus Gastranaerophilales bacterium]